MEIITLDQPRICRNERKEENPNIGSKGFRGFLAKLFPYNIYYVYDIYITVHLPEKNTEHYSQEEYTAPEFLQFKQLKQDVLNQCLKDGYRAPQNEIAKYLLHNCFLDMSRDSDSKKLIWGPLYTPLGPSLMMTKNE